MQNPHWNIIGEPTVTLFHRSLVREFDFFTPALIQRCDMEYWVRLGTNVGVVHVAEFLATYRFHDKSMTSRNLAKRKYAMTMLDPLITQYLFLHEKYYAAFRKELFRTSGRLVTWWRLVRLAHKAWETAQNPSAAPELPANWQQATKMYPRFRTLALIGQVFVPIRLALSAVGLNKLQKNKS